MLQQLVSKIKKKPSTADVMNNDHIPPHTSVPSTTNKFVDNYYKDFNRTSQQRSEDYATIRLKYPDRIPVILISCSKNICIPKNKFLVQKLMTVSQFMYVVRKHINLKEDEAIFLLVYKTNSFPPSHATMHDIDQTGRLEDNSLVITIHIESVFGFVQCKFL